MGALATRLQIPRATQTNKYQRPNLFEANQQDKEIDGLRGM